MPVAGSTCGRHEAQMLTPHRTRLKIPPASEPEIWRGGGFLFVIFHLAIF